MWWVETKTSNLIDKLIVAKCLPMDGKQSLKEAWLDLVNHLNLGGYQPISLERHKLQSSNFVHRYVKSQHKTEKS